MDIQIFDLIELLCMQRIIILITLKVLEGNTFQKKSKNLLEIKA